MRYEYRSAFHRRPALQNRAAQATLSSPTRQPLLPPSTGSSTEMNAEGYRRRSAPEIAGKNKPGRLANSPRHTTPTFTIPKLAQTMASLYFRRLPTSIEQNVQYFSKIRTAAPAEGVPAVSPTIKSAYRTTNAPGIAVKYRQNHGQVRWNPHQRPGNNPSLHRCRSTTTVSACRQHFNLAENLS